MTPAQVLALARPCRTVEDLGDPAFDRSWRHGVLIVAARLTVDLGESGAFLPPGMGPAAWHVAVGLALEPMPETPVPTQHWSAAMHEFAIRAMVEGIGDVGVFGAAFPYRGIERLNYWRRLTDEELRRVGAEPSIKSRGDRT